MPGPPEEDWETRFVLKSSERKCPSEFPAPAVPVCRIDRSIPSTSPATAGHGRAQHYLRRDYNPCPGQKPPDRYAARSVDPSRPRFLCRIRKEETREGGEHAGNGRCPRYVTPTSNARHRDVT